MSVISKISARTLLVIMAVILAVSLGFFDYNNYRVIVSIEKLSLQLSEQINLRGLERYQSARYLSGFNHSSTPLTEETQRLVLQFQQNEILSEHYQSLNLTESVVRSWSKFNQFLFLRNQVKQLKKDFLTISHTEASQKDIAEWLEEFISHVNQLQALNLELNQFLQLKINAELTKLITLNYISLIIVILFCSVFFGNEYRRNKKQTTTQLKLLEEKNSLLQFKQAEIEAKNIELENERQSLVLSELRRKTINQLLPVGMMLVDQNGLIAEVNEETCRLFGFTQPEMLGMKVDNLVPEAKRSGHDKLRKSFEESATPRIMAANKTDLSGQRKDGSLVPLEIGLAPVHLGDDSFMLATLLNVEERREAMESLKHKNLQMDIALDKLRNSNEQLERFAFVCSHDLQEPVRMVISFSQLLEKKAAGQLDDKCLGYLSHITNGAERARDMISDILTFCRLDQVSNSYENIELSEICEQVKLTLQPTLEDKNAEFVWPQSLPKIVGVKSQIFQLIMNLVGNGIKFNRSPTPKVEITAENNEDHWLLKVNDNGIGIEEKYFHKLFHIFGRLNSKSEFPGTGVGLAICKKIVEQHDGAISIESNRGAGTTFVIKWTKFVSDNQHLN